MAAVVDNPTGDRGRFGMRVSFHGQEDRRWAAFPVRMHGLGTFDNAPAVIATAVHAVDHLPELPTNVRHPQCTGLAIDAHAPRVAQSVGPYLRSGVLLSDKWIIGGHTVGLLSLRMIHINAEYG